MYRFLFAETKEVTLKASTPILLATTQKVTGKDSSVGDIIGMKVIRPVKVDGIYSNRSKYSCQCKSC